MEVEAALRRPWGGLGGRGGGGKGRLVPITSESPKPQPDGPYCSRMLILGKPRTSLSQPAINQGRQDFQDRGFVFRGKET